ncbi:MAG: glycoside hydrolase family 1 protein [Candidatus Omnitrophica bacterium]|nr:glycoside hydrolase family 1 protein [Candidatus Omnitrophota bacterium]
MGTFPKGFLWGAATSSYQVEGNNNNCDWWEWEKKTNHEQSGAACRHYELYEQDFDLAKELGHNAHRFSIGWSRVEPQEGVFSESEIEHYRRVIRALKERGLEPVVTLHHFTNPLWLVKLGGWEKNKVQDYFLRYVKKIVDALSQDVRFWITINEPLIYVSHCYIMGVWPPQEKSTWKAKQVENNLLKSHIKAYNLIHGIYRNKNIPSVFVSFAKNMQAFVPYNNSWLNKLAVYLRNKFFNFEFVEQAINKSSLDFIGINYYSRSLVNAKNPGFHDLFLRTANDENIKKNSLGWDIYPQGLYDLLVKLKKFKLPVMISENGICTSDDNLRWEYIREHLKSLAQAMSEGVEVWGYLYWSLLDNFEWDKGFGPRFGLIEVDYQNYKRNVRGSARKLAEVCRTGVVIEPPINNGTN